MKTLKQRQIETGRTLALNSKAWYQLRARVLDAEPLCRHCAARGLTVPATDVDHMNGADDNRLESLQPLCHECHSRKTQANMGKAVRYGCDSNGWPLDPASHWRKSLATDSPEPPRFPFFTANPPS